MIKTISISDLLNQHEKSVSYDVDKIEEMVEPENIEFPHTHNFYEILWITNGKSQHTIDYNHYEILPDTLFFISPGQLHLFEEWSDIEGYCIVFTEHFFLPLFQNKNILFELSYLDNLWDNPYLPLKKEDKNILVPIVCLLYQESKSLNPSDECIQALLLVFLRQIQKIFAGQKKASHSTHQLILFKKFKNLVEINYAINLSISGYAEQMNISAHYLNNIVRVVIRRKAIEIIHDRIIVEARQLLNFSNLTITEISYQLGFDDSSYFARFFKRKVGKTPRNFRKAMSEKYRKPTTLS